MKKIILLFLMLASSVDCISQTQPIATYVQGGINVNVQTNWLTVANFLGYTYTINGNVINISVCYHITPLLMESSLNNDLFIATTESNNYDIILTAYSSESYEVCDYSTVLSTTSVLLSNKDFNENSNTIKIFPNPSNGSLKIEAKNQKINSVKIYNAVGQLLKKFMNLENDISDLENGTYIIILDTENGVVSKKLILQK